MTRRWLVFASMFLACAAGAAEGPLSAGDYIRSRDSGTLTIRWDDRRGLRFDIEAVGSNCHTCTLSGTLRDGSGRTDPDDSVAHAPACVVGFKSTGSGIEVQPTTEEACRYYCGARGYFDGVYKPRPEVCEPRQIDAGRAQFLALYRSRKYPEAANALGRLMTRCEHFIDWITIDRMRNDIALAQLHSGDPAQCLKTLESTAAAQLKGEEDLRSGGSCDAEMYLEVAKATWFNQALCRKQSAQKK